MGVAIRVRQTHDVLRWACREHWPRPAVRSVQFEGLGGRVNDLPQSAVCPDIPDPAIAVRALLLEHAEEHELAELLASGAGLDDFSRWLRLKEAWLVSVGDPHGQLQAACAAEEQLANLICIHWRVPLTDYFLFSRI